MTLLTVRTTSDAALVVLIWLVQVIIYPSFQHVDRQRLDIF